ncbi:restriction endonuclease subunit S [Enterococcus gallinarum]|nr:restriction endonuclease subunit S [Enterococcus gallinarum]MDT2730419.1 restriction endonuclease subunit S [Enterococcus gallinarum]
MSKKSPQLRFEGFTDDWEERKLKELGDIQTGNTPPTSDSDNYSLDGVLWVTPTDIKSLVISNTAKKLSQVGVTKARIAKAGSILVTSIASIGKNTLLRMDAGFNQQINSLTPTSENDSYFLLTQSEKWSEKMKQTAASATMQIVNKTDFSNISTYVPVHKEEQEKIGSFFKQLDDTIALHQRKLDLLKEQKKGYLQKMFPKNGAKVPELRFAGFADDWEERKLKDIFDIHTDFVSNGSFQALKDNVKLYKTENYAYMIRLQDASNNWSGPWLYTDKQGFDFLSKSMVYKDDILMSDRGTIGKFFLVPQLDKPMTLSSNAVLLRSTKNDNNFIYYMLNTSNISNQIIVRTTPGVQPMISKTEFKKINTRIPNIQEQQKIGSFFKQLDNTIALHQLKLDLLKEQKKGFLQKMFA